MMALIEDDYRDNNRDRDPLTAKIIKACCHVHNQIGPGF